MNNPNYELKRCHLEAIVSREISGRKQPVTSIAIMQGDSILAISQATISDLIGLSLNFFVLPLLNSGTLKSSNFLINHSTSPNPIFPKVIVGVTLLVSFPGQCSWRSPARIAGTSPCKQPIIHVYYEIAMQLHTHCVQ